MSALLIKLPSTAYLDTLGHNLSQISTKTLAVVIVQNIPRDRSGHRPARQYYE